MRECENARMRECENARMRECENARMRECENARMRECENARMRECENARRYADWGLSIHKYWIVDKFLGDWGLKFFEKELFLLDFVELNHKSWLNGLNFH